MTVRAVVDPGVLISALLVANSNPAKVLDAWRRGRFELISSEQLVIELSEVLERPKLANRVGYEEKQAVLALLAEEADVHIDPVTQDPLTEDPDDDYLAALALAAGAGYLITGDRALRRWRSKDVRVMTPQEFLEMLDSEG